MDSKKTFCPNNCWEYMKCTPTMKKQCDVFKLGYGNECWHIPKINLKDNNNSNSCSNCEWYKKNNGKF